MGGSRDAGSHNGCHDSTLSDTVTSRCGGVQIRYRSAGIETPTSTTDLRDSYVVPSPGLSDIRNRVQVATSNRYRDRMLAEFKSGHAASGFISGYQTRNQGSHKASSVVSGYQTKTQNSPYVRSESSRMMQRYGEEFGRYTPSPRSEREPFKFLPNDESYCREWVGRSAGRSDIRPKFTGEATYIDISPSDVDLSDPAYFVSSSEQLRSDQRRQRGARAQSTHSRPSFADAHTAITLSREPSECAGPVSSRAPRRSTATDPTYDFVEPIKPTMNNKVERPKPEPDSTQTTSPSGSSVSHTITLKSLGNMARSAYICSEDLCWIPKTEEEREAHIKKGATQPALKPSSTTPSTSEATDEVSTFDEEELTDSGDKVSLKGPVSDIIVEEQSSECLESATPSPEPSLASSGSTAVNKSASARANSISSEVEPITFSKEQARASVAPTPDSSKTDLADLEAKSKSVRFDVIPSESASFEEAAVESISSVSEDVPNPGTHRNTEVGSNESLMPSFSNEDVHSAPKDGTNGKKEPPPVPEKPTSTSKEPPPVPKKPTKVNTEPTSDQDQMTSDPEHPDAEIEELSPSMNEESKSDYMDSASSSQDEPAHMAATDTESTSLHGESATESTGTASEIQSDVTDHTPSESVSPDYNSTPDTVEIKSPTVSTELVKSPTVSTELVKSPTVSTEFTLGSSRSTISTEERPKPELDKARATSFSGSYASNTSKASVRKLSCPRALRPRSAYICSDELCWIPKSTYETAEEKAAQVKPSNEEPAPKSSSSDIPRNFPVTKTTPPTIQPKPTTTSTNKYNTTTDTTNTGQKLAAGPTQTQPSGKAQMRAEVTQQESLEQAGEEQRLVEPSRTHSSLFNDHVWDLIPSPCSGQFALLMVQVDVGSDTEYNTIYEKTFDYWTQDYDQIEQTFVAKNRIIDEMTTGGEEGEVTPDQSATTIGSIDTYKSVLMPKTPEKKLDPLLPDKTSVIRAPEKEEYQKHIENPSMASAESYTQKQPENEISAAQNTVSESEEVSYLESEEGAYLESEEVSYLTEEDTPVSADDTLEELPTEFSEETPIDESTDNTVARRKADDSDVISVEIPDMDKTDSDTSKTSKNSGKTSNGKKRKLSLPFWFKRKKPNKF